MRFVLDSSFIAKLITDEELSDEAIELYEREHMRELELIASQLAVYEVGNVIWKKVKKSGGDGGKYLEALLSLDVLYIGMEGHLTAEAMRIAQENDVTFYDAIHVATAESRQANLLTEDRELQRKFSFAISIRDAVDMLSE
jgi:predicted nucleic acid-binding protein